MYGPPSGAPGVANPLPAPGSALNVPEPFGDPNNEKLADALKRYEAEQAVLDAAFTKEKNEIKRRKANMQELIDRIYLSQIADLKTEMDSLIIEIRQERDWTQEPDWDAREKLMSKFNETVKERERITILYYREKMNIDMRIINMEEGLKYRYDGANKELIHKIDNETGGLFSAACASLHGYAPWGWLASEDDLLD